MATDVMLAAHVIGADLMEEVASTFEDGDIDHSKPDQVVAALFALDKALGLDKTDDQLIMDPDFGVMFLTTVTVTDPPLVRAMVHDPEISVTHIDRALVRATTWFRVRCIGDASGNFRRYHPELIGRTLQVRFMTEEEHDRATWKCATVRADGTVITPAMMDRQTV